MSTKQTIKAGPGFHLYTDVLEGGTDGKRPVYLSLTDCDFAVFSEDGKSGITVKLTEAMAERLGLLDGKARI